MTTTIVWGGDLADLSDGDMDPSGRDLDGDDPEVMKQALYRRYTTEPNGLFYDLTYGKNIRSLLSECATDSGISAFQSALVEQALLDERIEAAVASVEFDRASSTAVVQITCESALGPFDLTLSIDQVTVQVLNQGV